MQNLIAFIMGFPTSISDGNFLPPGANLQIYCLPGFGILARGGRLVEYTYEYAELGTIAMDKTYAHLLFATMSQSSPTE